MRYIASLQSPLLIMTQANKVIVLKAGYNLAKDSWKQLATKHNVEIVPVEPKSQQEYIDILSKNDVIAIANTVPGAITLGGYTKEVYGALKSVKVIAHQGAGYDCIDAKQLHSQGIVVSNTPDAVATSTADTGIYLTLATLRNFNALGASLRRGEWLGGLPLAEEAEGKTLGILGLGGIGAIYRDKARALFDFDKIQYHNRKQAPKDVEQDSVYVDFDTLIKTSDVIYVSVPLNNSTHHLISKEVLSKAKDGVFIINTARGPVIDEEALVAAIESGKVASVGLDVFENEPKIHPGLIKNEKTVLLPHAGTHTITARRKMEKQVIKNIDEFLTSGKVVDLVPECK